MRRQRIETLARHLARQCAGMPPSFWLELRRSSALPINTHMTVGGVFYNVEIDVGFVGIVPGGSAVPTVEQRDAAAGFLRLSVAVDDAEEPFASMPISVILDVPYDRDEAYAGDSFLSGADGALMVQTAADSSAENKIEDASSGDELS